MRNLRKLTAAILAVALVLTSMTAVFAADATATVANADKAATLKDLGLYAGQDEKDPAVGLENALTTQDSLIFLAKLFGYYDTASALSDDEVSEGLAKFDDAASISDYAKNVVAYSAVNGILSGSTKDGKFFVGAKDTVTAARFATFMLKQMGYKVADYKVSVAELAETEGSKVSATITGDLTRDDAVGMMYGVLTAEKASGTTVITDIVGDNAELKAKAEKLGLIAAPVTEDLEVVSVKALNNKQLEVVFNQEMDEDSAEDKDSYTIKDKGETEKTLTEDSCVLGDDKKTVTITLDNAVLDCLTNASKAKVIIDKDIKAVNEKTLGADKEVEIEVQDGLLPTVKEVKATGEKNIKITFSEPVYEGLLDSKTLTNGNFAVKSGTYTYYVQKAELSLDVINLEVGTKLIEGPVTVTVNDRGLNETNSIQDYAGYKVFKGEHTFNYVKDTSVSVVTVKEAKPYSVKLGFSKPVKAADLRLFHSTKNAANYQSNVVSTESKYVDEIEFKFDTKNPVPAGNINLYLVNSDTDSNKLIDGYGIKVPDQTLTATVVVDVTGPTVSSKNVDKNLSVKLTFNEELKEETVKKSANYTFKSVKDGKTVYFTIEYPVDNNKKVVKLNVPGKLDDNTEYEVVVKKAIEDAVGNKMENDYVTTFTTGDNTAPEIKAEDCYVVQADGKIYLKFSEPMNEAQMLDKANYMVKQKNGAAWRDLSDDDKISKISDKIVLLDLYGKTKADEEVIDPDVKIAPIMDLANKRLFGKVDSVLLEKIGVEAVNFKSAELIEANKIKLVFNTKLDTFSNPDIEIGLDGAVTTTSGAVRIASVESQTVNDDGNTEIVFVLDKDVNTDATFTDDLKVKVPVALKSNKDKTASKSTSGTLLGKDLTIAVEDKTAPEISKIKFKGDDDETPEVVIYSYKDKNNNDIDPTDNYDKLDKDSTALVSITFTEDMDYASMSKLSFTVDGYTIKEITKAAGNKFVLSIKAKEDNTPARTSVTQVYNVSDSEGNVLASGSTWTIRDIADK
ncbi:Ig-like domain-containing protein [Ruminiclostridium sufflavum DSM 19573]|uniref:Ig-like domain-containing protein n=1 Tax=Ruminiclostridium sufflavum DSM 19573 TaxID=1121337 RepID=A0A318XIZ9_9FIRM|nr:Ig-like domain-containing protein [Ruminiclostridium sufflavum]PYG87155.1 Ig-like domain-containing protein [Ruminiclostridium sufflavum DSM 19573]